MVTGGSIPPATRRISAVSRWAPPPPGTCPVRKQPLGRGFLWPDVKVATRYGAIRPMRVVCSYGPLDAGLFRGPVGPISIGRGPFSNPAAIRDLPGVVIRSLPSRFATYPSSINRARCWAGMTAGGSRTAHVLPTARREANSSGVRGSDSHAIVRLSPLRALERVQICSDGRISPI